MGGALLTTAKPLLFSLAAPNSVVAASYYQPSDRIHFHLPQW